MDLDLDQATRDFQLEVRDWLAANKPAQPLPSMDTKAGFEAHREWEHTLAEARYSVVSWPQEYGGRDASLLEWVLFEQEYYAAGAPGRVSQNGIFLLAPTLFEHGSPEQLARIMPRMARADDIWAQAWSEPEAGSDLAGIRSTARRTDGGWLLSGQKTWSSRAAYADRAFGLFRSDPEAERHRGLTYVMFPLDAEGVTVRPIPQLDGEPGFAEIFLDEVFVPDADVIGAPNEGWRVAMSTSSNERGLSLRSPGRFSATAQRLIDLWASGEDTGTAARDKVVDAWIGSEAYRLHTFGTVTRLNEGGKLGAESSITKVFWSELDIAMHETALDLLGDTAELAGPWTDGYLFSLSGPIYAGTNEIQRNIIAERLLGLPRGGSR
ncbi:acyl-CoA dehydrogenase family protein [Nocardia cyriacigeorgica]|uniref:(R)-benzylsuccinyl-CoA dehydrogenase n=1 Tax=Nocardia cyriacigeorgica TaxID=135487 RepID=A0A4U8W541_9NOCA|nr:acyl-CoA dehydrogenase family protein [Nocardia cyriacigeorgica]MBF6099570.1 acyl-CoA dehydrogenase family protein [Nocardia cyriacigeorgica]MBF6160102.1 acyl-CoA dehydrogenase family protein [Nocardia cyriacigeorgica]MBF6199186.1 acyl-CoA dehydrogenase family protein [Nocardia cyriacigeorgica]MBF6319322.1 acyl-CoA dehydrogenase family protein [Nocardia cyriacigeorgica]MBF6343402.1 acyl-CoA dehydrogenase family protein [Nocardia cyriacigeorgica]